MEGGDVIDVGVTDKAAVGGDDGTDDGGSELVIDGEAVLRVQVPHVRGHVRVKPSIIAQRPTVSLRPTHSQDLICSMPLFKILNLNVESAQFRHLQQDCGHCSRIPGSLHLEFLLTLTQEQYRLINFPSFITLNRNGESSQSYVGEDVGTTGADVL